MYSNVSSMFPGGTEDEPDWNAVRVSDPQRLAICLAYGPYFKIKSEMIVGFLQRVHATFGKTCLQHFLDKSQWPANKVREFLSSIRGLGPKTISCVMLYALDRGAFPVDANILKIGARCGWFTEAGCHPGIAIETKSTDLKKFANSANGLLESKLGDPDLVPRNVVKRLYRAHVQMLAHGEVICRTRDPLCEICPLASMCAVGNAKLQATALLTPPVFDVFGLATTSTTTTITTTTTTTGAESARANTAERVLEQNQRGDLHGMLGLTPADTLDPNNVKRAFRRLALSLHPDKNRDSDQERTDEAFEAASLAMQKLTPLTAYPVNGSVILKKGGSQDVVIKAHPASEMPDSERNFDRDDFSQLLFSITVDADDHSIVRGRLFCAPFTALNGSFPMRGTYFYQNEVFEMNADAYVSSNQIDFSRSLTILVGESMKGMFSTRKTYDEIRKIFGKTRICTRVFSKGPPRQIESRRYFTIRKEQIKDRVLTLMDTDPSLWGYENNAYADMHNVENSDAYLQEVKRQAEEQAVRDTEVKAVLDSVLKIIVNVGNVEEKMFRKQQVALHGASVAAAFAGGDPLCKTSTADAKSKLNMPESFLAKRAIKFGLTPFDESKLIKLTACSCAHCGTIHYTSSASSEDGIFIDLSTLPNAIEPFHDLPMTTVLDTSKIRQIQLDPNDKEFNSKTLGLTLASIRVGDECGVFVSGYDFQRHLGSGIHVMDRIVGVSSIIFQPGTTAKAIRQVIIEHVDASLRENTKVILHVVPRASLHATAVPETILLLNINTPTFVCLACAFVSYRKLVVSPKNPNAEMFFRLQRRLRAVDVEITTECLSLVDDIVDKIVAMNNVEKLLVTDAAEVQIKKSVVKNVGTAPVMNSGVALAAVAAAASAAGLPTVGTSIASEVTSSMSISVSQRTRSSDVEPIPKKIKISEEPTCWCNFENDRHWNVEQVPVYKCSQCSEGVHGCAECSIMLEANKTFICEPCAAEREAALVISLRPGKFSKDGVWYGAKAGETVRVISDRLKVDLQLMCHFARARYGVVFREHSRLLSGTLIRVGGFETRGPFRNAHEGGSAKQMKGL